MATYYLCPTLEDLRLKLNELHESGIDLKILKWNGFDDEVVHVWKEDHSQPPFDGFEPR